MHRFSTTALDLILHLGAFCLIVAIAHFVAASSACAAGSGLLTGAGAHVGCGPDMALLAEPVLESVERCLAFAGHLASE